MRHADDSLLSRGVFGVEAFDGDVSLGLFPDREAAISAVSDRRDRKSRSNGGDPPTKDEPCPILAAALGCGWDVFPAPPGEKKSYKSAKYSNGAKWGKTRNPEQIRRDWQEWPDANIGIPTGKDNGFFVVEADTKEGHGVDGLAGMKQLEAEHGQLPDTRMAESPSGSIHRYFKHPGGDVEIKNSVSEIAPGVDVRGDGGMVIAPPSVRKDGTYRWLNDLPVADAPGWLIEQVKKKPRTPRSSGDNQSTSRSASWPEADAGELAAAMAVIPNNDSVKWTKWNNIGMALWRATDGSGEGLDLFDSWSQTWPCGYDAAYTAARWDGYETCPPTEIGAGTIFYMADQARPTWRREYEERVARRRAEQIKRNIEIGDDVAELAVPLILTPKEMIERLVWIGFSGAVVDRVTFRTRKKDQASSEYAASVYFPKEDEEKDEAAEEKKGEPKPGKPKAKTRKSKPIPCLNIWMQSPKRTTVDVLAWVPGGPQFCCPPENFNNAQTAFNTWRGITPMPTVENWQERCEPFVDHVAYLVPVESERQRFMQWLAHIIQQPEVLPHTSYLMVTPKTGIGRNWMSSVLVRVLRGYVAAGVSLPELLDGGFNGRLSCKLLAIVDELREGPSSRRYERGQRLKSIITEENRQINPKYGIQSIEKNCCRWLKFSNFFDALPFDNTDRRIETIANPTERKTTRVLRAHLQPTARPVVHRIGVVAAQDDGYLEFQARCARSHERGQGACARRDDDRRRSRRLRFQGRVRDRAGVTQGHRGRRRSVSHGECRPPDPRHHPRGDDQHRTTGQGRSGDQAPRRDHQYGQVDDRDGEDRAGRHIAQGHGEAGKKIRCRPGI